MKPKRSISSWPIALTGIFVLSVVLYAPSLLGAAIWDDFDLISGAAFGGNSFRSAFTHPFLGHYFRPLTSASFVLESQFANGTPIIYHQINILAHALTAVLISCLALQITGRRAAGILAGLFFATQPLQVGAAAWIGGRTDVLSALFLAAFMVSLVAYHKSSKWPWLLAAAFAYFLAGLSKEQAMAILPAVPLSVYVFGSGRRRDALRICIPFLLVIVAFVVLWILDAPAPHGGKLTLLHAPALALRTLAHYSLAFLTPYPRAIITFTLENYRGPLWTAIGGLFFVGVVAFLLLCWRRARPLAWVALCGLLVYLPIANLPPVLSFVVGPYRCAEPGTAVACVFGVLAAYAARQRNALLGLALAANLIGGAGVTWWGIHQWKDPLSFFTVVAKADPHFVIGVGNYAHTLEAAGHPDQELVWTNRVLSWLMGTPNWVQVLNVKRGKAFTPQVIARLQTNGGTTDYRGLAWVIGCHASGLELLRRHAEAVEVQGIAVDVAPQDPRIHFVYGQMLEKVNFAEAVHQWETALKLAPKYAACASVLAGARIKQGRYAEAVKLLTPIIGNVGWDSDVWVDFGFAKMKLGDLVGARDAIAHAEKAVFVKRAPIEALKKQLSALESSKKRGSDTRP